MINKIDYPAQETIVVNSGIGLILLFTHPILFLIWLVITLLWWSLCAETDVMRNILTLFKPVFDYLFGIGCLWFCLWLLSLIVK